MTVYIDLLFFLNLLVDYFILSLTSRLSGAAAGVFRQLGGAAVGALFSFVIFLPAQPLPLELLSRLVFSAVIILCAYGYGGREEMAAASARIQRPEELERALRSIAPARRETPVPHRE